ncbi:hypothetical protein Bca4012_027812 [Brassica carinata]
MLFFSQVVPLKKGRLYGLGFVSDYTAPSAFTPSPMITTLQTELHEAKMAQAQQKKDLDAQMTAMKEGNEKRFKAFEDRISMQNYN